MKYIIGNWKANKTVAEVKDWVQKVKAAGAGSSPALQLVVCPSLVHLPIVSSLWPELTLGAQMVSPFPNGSYTGAVSALMVKDFAKFVIAGHVERRTYFGETDQIVANQVIQALENDLTPIVAVEKKNWSSQLSQFDNNQLKKILVMYEPAEAISSGGKGNAADLAEVKEAVQLIKSEYPVKGVLYGGSVNSQNIATYLKETDGVVPGAASLRADEFVKMVRAATKI